MASGLAIQPTAGKTWDARGRGVFSLLSPTTQAPAPLCTSAVPRNTDSAVDISDIDIFASSDILHDTWRKRRGGDEQERQEGALGDLESCCPFYTTVTLHLPHGIMTKTLMETRFAKKPLPFTQEWHEGQGTRKRTVSFSSAQELYPSKVFFTTKGKLLMSKEHRCIPEGATSRSTPTRSGEVGPKTPSGSPPRSSLSS